MAPITKTMGNKIHDVNAKEFTFRLHTLQSTQQYSNRESENDDEKKLWHEKE